MPDTHVKYKKLRERTVGTLKLIEVATMEGEVKNGKFKKSKDKKIEWLVLPSDSSQDRIDAGLKRKIRRESKLEITDVNE